MHLILGIIASAWNNIYNAIFGSLDESMKNRVGLALIVVAILLLALSMKGSKKSQVIHSWFLFWLSAIVLVVSILYLVY